MEVVADTTGFVETAVVRGELNGAFADCSKDKLELLGVLLCVCVLAEAPFSSCGAGFFNGDLNGERKGFERVCVAASMRRRLAAGVDISIDCVLVLRRCKSWIKSGEHFVSVDDE